MSSFKNIVGHLNDDVLFNHGYQLKLSHQYQNALPVFQKLVKQNPQHFDAWCLLGVCAYRARDFDVAAHAFNKAKLCPQTHGMNGHCLEDYQLEMLMDFQDIQSFQNLAQSMIEQHDFQGTILDFVKDFSVPYGLSTAEVETSYTRYVQKSEHISYHFVPSYPNIGAVVNYHASPKVYLESVHQALRQASGLHAFDTLRELSTKKKILFVSSNLTNPRHATARYYGAFLRGLRDAGFHVSILQTNDTGFHEKIFEDMPVILTFPDFKEAYEVILSLSPDIIVYPDPFERGCFAVLSSIRLASIQCVLGGHPMTSGKDTIDYFMGHAAWDAEDPQPYYSEKFVPLSGFPIDISPPTTADLKEPVSRATWFIPENAPLYVCVQNCRKIVPETLDLYMEILHQDPDAFLAYIDITNYYFGISVSNYIQKNGPDVAHRMIALPDVVGPHYFALIEMADVILDTSFFGGGMTTFDCLFKDQPIVCLEQNYLRGRITAALQRHIGIEDVIAKNEQDFVQIAIRLAHDSTWRTQLRQQIHDNKYLLFHQKSGVKAFVAWFENVFKNRT